jgi:hypothetical protein
LSRLGGDCHGADLAYHAGHTGQARLPFEKMLNNISRVTADGIIPPHERRWKPAGEHRRKSGRVAGIGMVGPGMPAVRPVALSASLLGRLNEGLSSGLTGMKLPGLS